VTSSPVHVKVDETGQDPLSAEVDRPWGGRPAADLADPALFDLQPGIVEDTNRSYHPAALETGHSHAGALGPRPLVHQNLTRAR
jgi:hypothetical protein